MPRMNTANWKNSIFDISMKDFCWRKKNICKSEKPLNEQEARVRHIVDIQFNIYTFIFIKVRMIGSFLNNNILLKSHVLISDHHRQARSSGNIAKQGLTALAHIHAVRHLQKRSTDRVGDRFSEESLRKFVEEGIFPSK